MLAGCEGNKLPARKRLILLRKVRVIVALLPGKDVGYKVASWRYAQNGIVVYVAQSQASIFGKPNGFVNRLGRKLDAKGGARIAFCGLRGGWASSRRQLRRQSNWSALLTAMCHTSGHASTKDERNNPVDRKGLYGTPLECGIQAVSWWATWMSRWRGDAIIPPRQPAMLLANGRSPGKNRIVTHWQSMRYDGTFRGQLSAIYPNAVSRQNIASLGANSARTEGSSR
jgi:hypothetical protein